MGEKCVMNFIKDLPNKQKKEKTKKKTKNFCKAAVKVKYQGKEKIEIRKIQVNWKIN